MERLKEDSKLLDRLERYIKLKDKIVIKYMPGELYEVKTPYGQFMCDNIRKLLSLQVIKFVTEKEKEL